MIPIDVDAIIPDIKELIERQNKGALQNILIDLHPADIAQIFSHLKKEERAYLFTILPAHIASAVLAELDPPLMEELTEEVGIERISKIVSEMDSDDAADFVAALPEESVPEILKRIPKEESDEIKELLHYEEDTAGGIMALEYVALPATATVNEAIEEIRRLRAKDEISHVYSVYVVDEENHLLGTVSMTDLVLADGNTKLKDIMETDVPTVSTDMDQEEVANIFSKYDLVSMPVVDKENHLVGRITIDDIVDVLEEEGAEDMSYIAGAPDEEITEESTFKLARARLPWLLVAFGGEIISGYLMSRFQASIAQLISVVFFVPLIMAVGGNVGNQAAVVVIRGLATGEIALVDTRRRLAHEFLVALLNGLFLATLVFVISALWLHDAKLESMIAISMIVVIENAAFLGALIPFLLKKIGIDPAVATSPFITTSNDILGLLIYFSMVTIFMKFL